MTMRRSRPYVDPRDRPSPREQRAWLNGFFAGLLAGGGGRHRAGGCSPPAAKAPGRDGDDGAPWHDVALPIDERMQLAEGRPLPRKLFAAMAQQDCGQCGYNCETYSNALADGRRNEASTCASPAARRRAAC